MARPWVGAANVGDGTAEKEDTQKIGQIAQGLRGLGGGKSGGDYRTPKCTPPQPDMIQSRLDDGRPPPRG